VIKYLVIFISLMLVGEASALSPAVIGGVTVNGASGTCQASPYLEVTGCSDKTTLTIGSATDRYYRGIPFQTDAKTVCKFYVTLTKVAGDITSKTFTGRLWTVSGNNLATEIATSTGITGVNTWDGSVVTFEFSANANLSASTTYVFTVDQGAADASNYASMCMTGGDAQANWHWARYQSDGTYTSSSTSQDPVGGVYSYE